MKTKTDYRVPITFERSGGVVCRNCERPNDVWQTKKGERLYCVRCGDIVLDTNRFEVCDHNGEGLRIFITRFEFIARLYCKYIRKGCDYARIGEGWIL